MSNPAQNHVTWPVILDLSQILERKGSELQLGRGRPTLVGENSSRSMAPSLRRIRNRLRGRLAFFADWLMTLLAKFKQKNRHFKSLRMCPFCGLITSRYKTCCLECGKSFKPA